MVNLNEDLEKITLTTDIIEKGEEENNQSQQKRRDLKRTGSKTKLRKRGKFELATFHTINLL